MLEVRDLTRNYYEGKRGAFPAVDHVSFAVFPGEVFGLLGPNGAGKTTTLRMVAGILSPSAGSILLNGTALGGSSSIRRKLGFLSGSTGLYERLTPREILKYFARLNSYPDDQLEQRLASVIEMFGLQALANVRCDKLSSGERQKVSIARAVVHQPELLILDEPTSGLDVIAQQAFYDFVRICKTESRMILFSTHLMSEAEKLCDRIGILHRGRLFAVGTLADLRQRTGQHYLEDIFLSIVQNKEESVESF